MVIKRFSGRVLVTVGLEGGASMENVISIEKYVEIDTKEDDCEWDVIRSICKSAIKRNGFTKEQVSKNAKRLLREVRSKK